MSIFSEYKTVQRILSAHHPVIFYAESRHYRQYFERLMTDLLQRNMPVLYITSDKQDPLLQNNIAGVETVYVHWWLGFLFPRLKAGVMIMTMTDLDNYAFRRSKEVQRYVYMFHAMVSTHMQYTAKAFYHYDAIFCVSRSHVDEIKTAEEKYNLHRKDIVAYGYPLIDTISGQSKAATSTGNTLPTILVAPSWYSECILETCIEELIKELAALPYRIIIRPHPEYLKRRKKKMAALVRLVQALPAVSFDYSSSVIDALQGANILLTDRSGVAFEYALGLKRPVLFIDTPLKVMNPAWEELGIEPIENKYRERIGVALKPTELKNIPSAIEKINAWKPAFPNEMEELKKELAFNSESSYQEGVEYVIKGLGPGTS